MAYPDWWTWLRFPSVDFLVVCFIHISFIIHAFTATVIRCHCLPECILSIQTDRILLMAHVRVQLVIYSTKLSYRHFVTVTAEHCIDVNRYKLSLWFNVYLQFVSWGYNIWLLSVTCECKSVLCMYGKGKLNFTLAQCHSDLQLIHDYSNPCLPWLHRERYDVRRR